MRKTVSPLAVNTTKEYVSPSIEIVDVVVERGFAESYTNGGNLSPQNQEEEEFDYE